MISTKVNSFGGIVVYVLLGFALGILTEFLLISKKNLVNKMNMNSLIELNSIQKIKLASMYLVIIIDFHVLMYLMMGCNGWVILSIIIGQCVGYFYFSLSIDNSPFVVPLSGVYEEVSNQKIY